MVSVLTKKVANPEIIVNSENQTMTDRSPE